MGRGWGRKPGHSPTCTPAASDPPRTAALTALRPRHSARPAVRGWLTPGDPGRHPRGSPGTHLRRAFPTSRPRGRRPGAGEAGGQLWGSRCSPSACRARRNPSRGPRCTGTPLRGGGGTAAVARGRHRGAAESSGRPRRPRPARTAPPRVPRLARRGWERRGSGSAEQLGPLLRRTSSQPFSKRKMRCRNPPSKQRGIQTPEKGPEGRWPHTSRGTQSPCGTSSQPRVKVASPPRPARRGSSTSHGVPRAASSSSVPWDGPGPRG